MKPPRTIPWSFIFPLFEGTPDGTLERFRGTTFLVGSTRTLATAFHCVAGASLGLCIADMTDGNSVTHVELVATDEVSDLAVLSVTGLDDREPLNLGTSRELGLGTEVKTLEYSDTRIEDGKPVLSPATRMGYASRWVRPAGASLELMEMSFPALLGASGAPIINDWDGLVYGVLVANASYHLLPAQIETVLDERNEILEERRYMLPQGLAAPSDPLVALLARS